MKYLNLFIVLVLMTSLSSCKKFNTENPVETNKMETLNVPSGFDWSGNERIVLTVNTQGLNNGATMVLYKLDGNIIEKRSIQNNQVQFDIQIQEPSDTLRLYSPQSKKSLYFQASQTNLNFGTNALKSTHADSEDFVLDLDGSQQDYIKINNGNLGGIVTGFPFTFSAWFKTSGPSAETDDMVLVNIANPNYASKYYGLCIRKYTDSYKPVIVARNGSSERVKSFNQNVADGTWHQITGVFYTNNSRKIYIDGEYRGESTSEVLFDEDAVISSFGRWDDSTPSEFFNGQIDNVSIWDKALSDSEIKSFYDKLPIGNEIGLKGLWKFNEGNGTNINNSAVSGNYQGSNNGANYILISDPIADTDSDGVNDDDDDFPSDPDRSYISIYPSGNNYYYHLFEDLWPGLGDYDFNDVVLKSKISTYQNAQNKLVGGRVQTSVYWIGGGIPRGVGMEWFKDNGGSTRLTYLPDNTVTFNAVTNVTSDPLVFNAVKLFDGNIVDNLNQSVDFEYSWDHVIAGNSLWVQVYIYNDRDHEIHMYGHPPTKAQNMALFGTQHDRSKTEWDWTPGSTFNFPAGFYKTSTNLPWGLEIVASEFRVPLEKTVILDAYPMFKDWAESGGSINRDWYKHPDESKTFIPNR